MNIRIVSTTTKGLSNLLSLIVRLNNRIKYHKQIQLIKHHQTSQLFNQKCNPKTTPKYLFK